MFSVVASCHVSPELPTASLTAGWHLKAGLKTGWIHFGGLFVTFTGDGVLNIIRCFCVCVCVYTCVAPTLRSVCCGHNYQRRKRPCRYLLVVSEPGPSPRTKHTGTPARDCIMEIRERDWQRGGRRVRQERGGFGEGKLVCFWMLPEGSRRRREGGGGIRRETVEIEETRERERRANLTESTEVWIWTEVTKKTNQLLLCLSNTIHQSKKHIFSTSAISDVKLQFLLADFMKSLENKCYSQQQHFLRSDHGAISARLIFLFFTTGIVLSFFHSELFLSLLSVAFFMILTFKLTTQLLLSGNIELGLSLVMEFFRSYLGRMVLYWMVRPVIQYTDYPLFNVSILWNKLVSDYHHGHLVDLMSLQGIINPD